MSNTGQEPFRFLFVFPEDSTDAVQYHLHQQGRQDHEFATKPIESDPALTSPDYTPGSGMLPEVGGDDTNMQPSS